MQGQALYSSSRGDWEMSEGGNKVHRRCPLFDKVIPVKVVNAPEINANSLVCRLLMRHRSLSGGQVDKSYRLELTSNVNHYFVYYTEIAAAEFPAFQKNRELNCDFGDFSVYVVKLLNDVIQAKRKIKDDDDADMQHAVASSTAAASASATASPPKRPYIDLPDQLIAEFDYSTKTFTFLQQSAMKITRFLYFELTEADDEATKEYLSGRLQLALEHNKEYLEQLDDAGHELQEEKAHSAQLAEELAQLESKLAAERERLNTEKNDVIVSYTSKLSNVQSDGERTMIQQRREFAAETEELKAKNHALEDKLSKLSSDLREMDADKKTLQRQFETAVRDLERVQSIAKEVSEARSSAEQTALAKDSEVNRLQFMVAKLEQDLVNKGEIIVATKDLQKKAEGTVSTVSADLANARLANEQLQEYVNRNNAEIKKGNDSITQLLMTINQLKEKLVNKNDVIKTQESIISSLKNEALAATDAQNELKLQIKHGKQSQESLQADVRELKAQLTEAIEKVEQQDNALRYMHQTMDEQLLYGGGSGVGMGGSTAFTSGGAAMPPGIGLYSGGGVMTFPATSLFDNDKDGEGGGGGSGSKKNASSAVRRGSPSSIAKQSISPARESSTNTTQQRSNPATGGSDYKQSTATFLEKYGRSLGAGYAWNEQSMSSQSDAVFNSSVTAPFTGGPRTGAEVVTPDDNNISAAAMRNAHASASATAKAAAPSVPQVYTKKNVSYPGASATSVSTTSSTSSSNVNHDAPLLHASEDRMLRDVGIDLSDFRSRGGALAPASRSQRHEPAYGDDDDDDDDEHYGEDDDDDYDDIGAMDYYATSATSAANRSQQQHHQHGGHGTTTRR